MQNIYFYIYFICLVSICYGMVDNHLSNINGEKEQPGSKDFDKSKHKNILRHAELTDNLRTMNHTPQHKPRIQNHPEKTIEHLKSKLHEKEVIQDSTEVLDHQSEVSPESQMDDGFIIQQWNTFTDWLFVKRFDNIKEVFEEWLDDMLAAWIITQEQRQEIHTSLESPQVVESIKTWAAVFGFSGAYIGVNSVTITPLAALIWGPVAGSVAWTVMYLIKRIFVSGIVKYFGKNLERKDYISNMSLIPILWEQITLIELYKKYPLASQYFYAYMRTNRLRKKYINQDITTESNVHHKEVLKHRREKKINKNVKWMKTISDGVVAFETAIWDFFKNISKKIINK